MKKGRIILIVCVVLAAFLLIFYHLPRTFRWTGTAESHVNGVDVTSELTIDVRMWPKLFREPDFTGSVTVDGVPYEDLRIDSRFVKRPFVPASRKTEIAENRSKVYDDYLSLRLERWTGEDMLTIFARSGGITKEAPMGRVDRIFDIPLK
ncbi:MAG: hypothetical protein II953_05040 [Clostridia bacterium]|nr:hypothetical protein [Clostridia bacterium]